MKNLENFFMILSVLNIKNFITNHNMTLKQKQLMPDLEEREHSAFAVHERFAKATSEVELEKQVAWILMYKIRRKC